MAPGPIPYLATPPDGTSYGDGVGTYGGLAPSDGSTLNQIRGDILFLTQPYPLAATTSNSGATGAWFADGAHLVDALLGAIYKGGWLLRTGGTLGADNRERRVLAHDTALGRIYPTPPYFDVPALVESYELWTVDRPTYAERLINAAMARIRAPLDTPLGGVGGQRQYSLAAYPWLVRPSQVLSLVHRAGTTPNTEDTPVEGWRVYQSGSGLTLDLRESTFNSGQQLILRAMQGTQGTLHWSPASTTPAPRELLVYEAAYDLLRRPVQGIDTSPDLSGQRKERAADVKRMLLSVRDKYRSTVSVALFAETERWGIGATGHTPGARWG